MYTSLNLLTLDTLLLLCAALVASVSLRRKAWRDADVAWPFYGKKPLASPEHVLYQRLVTSLPGHIILSQVPVTGVLGVSNSRVGTSVFAICNTTS
jgi:hypothetical protein